MKIEVAVAISIGILSNITNAGTLKIPPPIPSMPDKNPNEKIIGVPIFRFATYVNNVPFESIILDLRPVVFASVFSLILGLKIK